MKKIIVGAVAMFLAVVSAQAYFIDPSINEITGSKSYEGTNLSVDAGDAFHIAPAFSEYHSDFTSNTTLKTYSLRAAYDTDVWGMGVQGGATPSEKNDNYRNNFFGADGIITLGPGTGQVSRLKHYQEASLSSQNAAAMGVMPQGLAGIDIGAGVTHIDHEDGALVGSGYVKVGQTNLRASGGVAFFDNLFTVDLTKSVYTGSIESQQMVPQVQFIQGISNVVQGFPDTSSSFKLAMGMMPMITPYISYTHTTFRQGEKASGAYVLGGSVNLMMLSVNAFYERYAQVGFADQNFIGLGAGISFE